MPDAQIFKATYSGIPVYEMMCKGVAVMRRRSDSWLNATQILKVAGFDKPQRTRVLEREVQKGEHEKVQGGYGKYQGTWIPLERGLSLAKQYNCDHILKPIIEFQPAAKSPPLAPKHLAAGAAPKPARRAPPPESASAVNTRSSRKQVADVVAPVVEQEPLSPQASEDGTMTPSPSESSSSSRTPSPIHSPQASHVSLATDTLSTASGRRKTRPAASTPIDVAMSGDELPSKANGIEDRRPYGDQMLEYFISDSNDVPPLLLRPPPDYDPNMAIDDDGHTPLHWACAMGRIRIVKTLLSLGADIFKVNKSGQTALMRSVMFANNYDVRKFPELYELLHRSTLNIDNYNRTLFHHIVDVAMSKGKVHASRYYMETVLGRLSEYPRELADIINFQDEDGETALTMAARCRSKRLVKILIDHGADPKIVNNDGKSTEDYILEDERFRSSPAPPSRTQSMSFRNTHPAYHTPHPPLNSLAGTNGSLPLHYSVAAQRASTRCTNDMANMLDSLAASFDQELHDKERDMAQAHALLTNIQQEILDSQRTVTNLKVQADKLPTAKQKLHDMKDELHARMGMRYRLGWEKWLKEEETREKDIRDAASGELVLMEVASYQPDDSADGVESDKSIGKRKAPSRAEDISDLLLLHEDIPTDEGALHQACESLRRELSQYKKRRIELFDELVNFQAEADTSERMTDYRRLIGIGCNKPPGEVDSVLGLLLETLEAEEPTASSIAWNTGRQIMIG
ncbi:apses-domain-containing protein [Pleurotus eryngii]|uniref:Apses-domain-containing protein n=1 Tax=Pleurotus eryngii TaxID=5323 RepID=A0A9P6A5L7_PLEER|nr:apses-domain-containing protein [Pleurotus eryngii]